MGKKYIEIKGECYTVKKFSKNKDKLKVGVAYDMNNGYVLPYYGKTPKEGKLKIGLYTDRDTGEIKQMILPMKKAMKPYKAKNIYEPNLNFIKECMEESGSKVNDMELIMSESDEVFAPPINDNDNDLLKLAKKVFDARQEDIKIYADHFGSSWALTNFTRSLTKHTKMSWEKFTDTMHMTGCNVKVIVTEARPEKKHTFDEFVIEIHN